MTTCRVCGCDDLRACMVEVTQKGGAVVETPCWWVESDLCSGCELAGDRQPDASPLLYDAHGRPIDFGDRS